MGWFKVSGELKAGLITIHNALAHSSTDFLEHPKPTFEVRTRLFQQDGKFMIAGVGQNLHREDKGAIFDLISRCMRRRVRQFATVCEGLQRSIIWLSSMNDRIGRGMVLVCIPRLAVEALDRTGDMLMQVGVPDGHESTIEYRSATVGKRTKLGPIFVMGSEIAFGFEAGPLDGDR